MIIGYDAKRAFHNRSGLGNYSRHVITRMAAMYPEHQYLLYTPREREPDQFTLPGNTRMVGPSGPVDRRMSGFWRTFRLAGDLERDRVALYHGLSNEIPVGIHRKEIPAVVTIHDLIFMRLPHLYKPIDRYLYRKKVCYAVKHAQRVIAVSEQTGQDLMELTGCPEKKIRVIYQGCHERFYESVPRSKKEAVKKTYDLPGSFLLYVGTIEERKNLLKVVRALHEGRLNIPLVVAGKKTGYYHTVEAYILEHNMHRVHFLSQVPDSDLPALYQAAHAFIYPSSYEGFGIPVLEAINSGLPVITSSGGCLEESAGGGGVFINPEDTGAMIHAIRQVTEDESLRKKLIAAGREHALTFREETTMPQLHALYKELLP